MGVPLYSVAELRDIEQLAQVGLPPGALMARAGAAAASVVRQRLTGARPQVVIICGPGNNGGDGYVCALALAQSGAMVRCVALAAPATDDARAAFARWKDAGGITLNQWPAAEPCDAIVDALFGIGMTRPLAGRFLETTESINRASAPVFALDLPSGLDADRGSWVGGVPGVRASVTITFMGAKPGLHTGDGCDAAGEIIVEAIGVTSGASRDTLLAPVDFADLLQARKLNSHKGSFGDVAVVGGNIGMVGAALLAGRAALRLGAGRVYVDCIGAPETRLDLMQPELMFRPAAELPETTVCVVGCGMGTDAIAHAALTAAIARDCPLILDADALNLLSADAVLAQACLKRGRPTVLTPHPLEAARLLQAAVGDVQADRIAHARQLAAKFNTMVVLKGAGSIIAAPDGRCAVNPTGTPALATPGSGDVLAGMIGALIAQSVDPLSAVCGAVWLHGAAADDFGDDVGLVASDVAALAAHRLARLRSSH